MYACVMNCYPLISTLFQHSLILYLSVSFCVCVCLSPLFTLLLSLSLSLYIYIYIYIKREREKDWEWEYERESLKAMTLFLRVASCKLVFYLRNTQKLPYRQHSLIIATIVQRNKTQANITSPNIAIIVVMEQQRNKSKWALNFSWYRLRTLEYFDKQFFI